MGAVIACTRLSKPRSNLKQHLSPPFAADIIDMDKWINGSEINVSHNAHDAVAHFSLSPNVSFNKSRAFSEVEKEKRKKERKNMN